MNNKIKQVNLKNKYRFFIIVTVFMVFICEPFTNNACGDMFGDWFEDVPEESTFRLNKEASEGTSEPLPDQTTVEMPGEDSNPEDSDKISEKIPSETSVENTFQKSTESSIEQPYDRSGVIVDRIVAVVNDDIITLVELNEAVLPAEKQIKQKSLPPEIELEELYNIRTTILNSLIEEKLADQEIKTSGIFVEEIEIDDAIEQVKAMNYYSDEDLRGALAAGGMNMDGYRKEIKKQILRNKLVNLKVKSKIIITESDISLYYIEHLDEYGSKNKYLLRNIILVFPPVLDDQVKKSVYDKTLSVYEKLKSGEPFEEIAKTYSEAINASEGGRLGLFEFDELAEPIQKGIRNLNPGEFSDIIETDQGYQIFYIEKISEIGGKELNEVEDEIRQLLYENSVNEKFESWVEGLRKEAHIKIIR